MDYPNYVYISPNNAAFGLTNAADFYAEFAETGDVTFAGDIPNMFGLHGPKLHGLIVIQIDQKHPLKLLKCVH